MSQFLDLTGQRFNRLVVLSPDKRGRRTYWLCRCDCGNHCLKETHGLRRADRKPSCGCEQRLMSSRRNSTHGMSKTRVYRSWSAMIERCTNPASTPFAGYGGRGIMICPQWRESFECFLKDMGLPPTNRHTIDRIDTNGNYEPDNCRWATPVEQARNTRKNVKYELNGGSFTIRELSEKFNIPEVTIRYRFNKGMSVHEAVSDRHLQSGSLIPSRRR